MRKHANNKINIVITAIKGAKEMQLCKYILAVMQPESDIKHSRTSPLNIKCGNTMKSSSIEERKRGSKKGEDNKSEK